MFTEDEVLNLVIEYDVNGDGTIDFDEFMEMMKKQAEHQVNFFGSNDSIQGWTVGYQIQHSVWPVM